ncbi:DUF397 domain-containing protein [Streptomyces carpaticus]|uniref:DUF397 domain-containing protein n=1 Tax=Streptomyces carpaticus TaxID=285558 RepID=A0ABV4ZSZ0_9ACTN
MWRRSSYGSDNGGQCVEVALTGARVGLRDSKAPDGSCVTVDFGAWVSFTEALTSSR